MKRQLLLLGLAQGPLASAVPANADIVSRASHVRRSDRPIAGRSGKSDRCLIGAKDTVSSCEQSGLPD